jgi:hypothetical protein
MKALSVLMSLFALSALSALVACGVADPFQRGEKLASDLVTPAGKPEAGDQLDEAFFKDSVAEMLDRKCSSCHDNPAPDFATAQGMVKLKDVSSSSLYLYATGKAGGHREVLKSTSAELAVLTSWINGATSPATPPPVATSTTTTTMATPVTTTTTTLPVGPSSTTSTTVPEAPITTTTTTVPAAPQELDEAAFDQKVLPVLLKKCDSCHDNPAPDFATAKTLVVFGQPLKSSLFLYATGKEDGHRNVLKETTAEYKILLNWINGLN